MALNKLNQLTKDKEFENVFKTGRSSYGSFLGIKSAPNGLSHDRFGILVSTKVSKKAVDRNKIKRQIREIIRLRLDKIKPGYDLVIITQPAILGKDYQELEKEIHANLTKLRLIEKA